MRILVVDDEPAVREAVERALRLEGHDVLLAADGQEALGALDTRPPDAIVLDVLMPRVDGLELCRRMRRRGDRTPVLMVTARDAVDDRVAGLDSGADDYLIKPFAFSELLARIRALLRREPAFKGTVLQVADLEMDTARRTVRRGDRPISLTSKEYSLLEFLMRHPNQILTRSAIAEHVWNYDFDNLTNLIDVHIFALRRKLDDPYDLKLLHTVRGVGYRLGE